MISGFAVQAFDDPADRDRVTDCGWYCSLCVAEGVRRWLLDDDRSGPIRLFKGPHIAVGDDEIACAGCGRVLYGPVANAGAIHPRWIGLAEAAERLGVAKRTVWRHLDRLTDEQKRQTGAGYWQVREDAVGKLL